MSGDDSTPPTSQEKLRWFEEQIAFLERELEHQKDQISDLWSELSKAKRQITRLTQRLDEGPEDDEED